MLEQLMSTSAGKKAKTGENGLEYKGQVNSDMKDTVFKMVKFLTSVEQEIYFYGTGIGRARMEIATKYSMQGACSW